jgi:hypothetical protein
MRRPVLPRRGTDRLGNNIFFFPIHTGMTILYTGWQASMWFDSWV